MNHVVMFSGGAGSFVSAQRVVDMYGERDVTLLFTDTLIEDRDLYRFVLEGYGAIFNHDMSIYVDRVSRIPDVGIRTMGGRKQALMEIRTDVRDNHPQLQWIADGRDPWDVFFDARYLGNTRIAHCSHLLKQDMAAKWMDLHRSPDDTVVHLGIDWTESHRKKKPTEHWSPYHVSFPMCEEPLLMKEDMIEMIAASGIATPRLYEEGFSHNNCGGFCVRAGQGQFVRLLETNPDLYAYHETREEELRQFLGKDVSILRDRTGGKLKPLTLRELRIRHQQKSGIIDMDDIGGCGCFVT